MCIYNMIFHVHTHMDTRSWEDVIEVLYTLTFLMSIQTERFIKTQADADDVMLMPCGEVHKDRSSVVIINYFSEQILIALVLKLKLNINTRWKV